MFEPKKIYVKPDVILDKKESQYPEGKMGDGYIMTPELEAEILALDEIHVGTVKKVMRCSSKRAEDILNDLHKEEKVKLESERYAELYQTKEDPIEVVKTAEKAKTLVSELDLTAGVISDLGAEDITTIEQLENMTEAEVLAVDGIGPVSLQSIIDALALEGKSLKAE